ncbi:MAG: DUF3800 domain-containing protein [Sulfurimonas sp.]|nr:DUF3800 domain-containing protein [Sulfurimonas sp.]
MKLIYIDDSGNTGKKLDDALQPLFLLGGFIIDEDVWKKVDKALTDVKSKYNIENLEIHSIEVMNGKKGTPYKEWNYDKKLKFFEDVLQIVKNFDLKVIYFSVKKSNFKKYFQAKYGKEFEQQFNISPYLLAFSYILQISDSYLVSQDSNGMLILDEQDEWKKPANKTFNILTTLAEEPEIHVEKLLDRSFFVDSSESNMIQLADIISYTTKRYLEIEIKDIDKDKRDERTKLFDIYKENIYKPSFDYGSHPILKWLEDNIGNQAKDKPIG